MSMTDPIENAGETTSIGLPAIQIPLTSTSDRPLSPSDVQTISKLAPGSALLVSTRGPESRYLLDEDVITVGRDPKADILLDDSTVSRQHALFRRVKGGYQVEDAGSLNGTYVNMKRVDSAVLHNGDTVIIGRYRLMYFTKAAIITR
jgi:pSer/pThr/pTyr-binding forkhead associated (FHA) protein